MVFMVWKMHPRSIFGRSVSDLSLSETAYICAIPNRPEYYNPLKNSEKRDLTPEQNPAGYVRM